MQNQAFNLPNLLTYGRILAVPLIVLCFSFEGHLEAGDLARWAALFVFAAAAVTDYLDGYLARLWDETSNIGKMLDPIADKLLVATCLLLLAASETIAGWSLFAGIVILCREILVSGLREYLAGLGVSVPVTRLAKSKTAFQMIAIAFLLVGPAGDALLPEGRTMVFGTTLLCASAIVTLYTGYDYFRAGLKHVMDDTRAAG
jgi:cardiolipin synthase (CMP-forming)